MRGILFKTLVLRIFKNLCFQRQLNYCAMYPEVKAYIIAAHFSDYANVISLFFYSIVSLHRTYSRDGCILYIDLCALCNGKTVFIFAWNAIIYIVINIQIVKLNK